MREIKFRAWDTQMPGWTVLPTLHADVATRRMTLYDVAGRMVIMQYTGLKDKNGVEIYFDDLVRDNDGLVYKVKYGGYFSKDGAGWGVHYYRCIPDTFALDASPFQHELGLEVIGNICENPELMDG